MTEQQMDIYCRLVARGDIEAANIFMQQCLRPGGVSASCHQTLAAAALSPAGQP